MRKKKKAVCLHCLRVGAKLSLILELYDLEYLTIANAAKALRGVIEVEECSDQVPEFARQLRADYPHFADVFQTIMAYQEGEQ